MSQAKGSWTRMAVLAGVMVFRSGATAQTAPPQTAPAAGIAVARSQPHPREHRLGQLPHRVLTDLCLQGDRHRGTDKAQAQ